VQRVRTLAALAISVALIPVRAVGAPATGDAPPPAKPPKVDAPAEPTPKATPSAFDLPPAKRDDPYGPRADGVPRLSIAQIETYALRNPMVAAADEQIDAMAARVRKAKFAWVPIIDTTMSLTPGVNIECDDISIETTDPDTPFTDFQFCRPGGDPDLDVQTAKGYFQQLGRAGVRFQFQLDTVIPLYTFGKLKNVKKIAETGLALTKLQKAATQQETILRVHQAHSTLLLARESIEILREAKKVVDSAKKRVEKDLGGSEDDFDAEPEPGDALRDPDDAIRVKLAALELEELLREALKVESLALSALWALAGTAAPRGFDIAAKDLTLVELEGGRQDLAHYKKLAEHHRPEARMAAAGVQLRKHQERLARSSFLPDLGIALSVGVARTSSADPAMNTLYYVDNYNYSRVTAALALRWRFDFHNDAFDLQASRAELRAAQHQREAARLLLGREVEEAYADLVDAATTEEIRRDGAQQAWRLVVSQEIKDTAGTANAAELLRALEKWYRLRFSHVEAAGQHNLAAARLARAVGTPLWSRPAP
jgi:outer membrane protein TolC